MTSMPKKAKPQAQVFGLSVSEVRIRGFRAFDDVTVSLDKRATILVGENNTGKTSFLEALSTALGRRRARIEDLQKTRKGQTKTFTIDLRIVPDGEEFPDAATQVFGSAIQGVTTDRPYVALRARADLDEAHGDVRLTRYYLKTWDGAAQQLQEPRPSERALELLPFESLDARRDILEQMRNRASLLGRTLSGAKFDDALRAETEAKLVEVAEMLRSKLPSLVRLREHLKGLHTTLPASVQKIDIDPIPQQLEELVRAVDIYVEDSSGAFPASALGMGTRALAALIVFRTFVDVTRSGISDSASSASIAAIEEPEAHLHPQAQRAVVRLMRDMPGQIVVSTHSREVVSQVEISDLRVFRREGEGVVVRQAVGGPGAGSEDSIKRRRLLLGRSGGSLFAKAVILCEGETECSLLPILADAWWDKEGGAHAVGIEVISCDGSGSTKHLVPPLESWVVPWWLVTDGDTGKATLKAVSTEIGRTLTDTSPEIALLAPRTEEYLLSLPGYCDLVFEVGRKWPDQSIDEWCKIRHGQALPNNGGNRDYTSKGWEHRAATDWMKAHKGTVGGALGRVITGVREKDGRPRLPPKIRRVFEAIDSRLKV